VLSDGRSVVAARTQSGFAVLNRRSANGGPDPFTGSTGGFLPFAIPGTDSTEFVDLLGVANGKFLAAGNVTTVAGGSDFFVARFNSDGTLDASFGSQPGYTRIAFNLDLASSDKAVALTLARDGRIAVVGIVTETDNEIGVAMLQANGQPDFGFGGNGKAVLNFDIGVISDDRAAGACFAPNGNLLGAANITSNSPNLVAGLTLVAPTGNLVNGFGTNGRRVFALFDDTVAAGVACAADGKFKADAGGRASDNGKGTRCISHDKCSSGLRIEHNLDATVFLVPERFVHPGSLVEADRMGDDEGWVDLPFFDSPQQVVSPAIHVGLPGADGQPLVHHGAERDLVDQSAINAGDGDDASGAADIEHLP
jgi:uncharacterized delta-60 repeat protein